MADQAKQHAPRIRRPDDEQPMPVVQRKLSVGRADDPLEREADQVATDVLARLTQQARTTSGPADDGAHSSRVQQTAATRGNDDGAIPQPATDRIRRAATTSGAIGLDGGAVSGEVGSRIQRARCSGSAMDDSTKTSMETAFGADFSGVRIHTGSESTKINRSLGAKAFTVGNDVFFSGNSYDPGSRGGQHLLAHELTHTVQQGSSSAVESAQRTPAAGISTDTEGSLRRWAIGPNLDLGRITSIRALGSQGQQTYIATDSSGDEILLKKANIPMNVTTLATLVHESVSPGTVVDSQAVDAANNSKLKQKIADPSVATGASWTTVGQSLNATELSGGDIADDARRVHAGLIGGGTLLTAQQVVQGGRNAKELSADARDGDPSWSASQLRYLLNDIMYMRQLGNMIAVDAFLGNEDRISNTGANLGNWMTTGEQVKRIDNMDQNAVANLTDKSWANTIPGILKEMVDDRPKYLEACVKAIVREAVYEGDPGIRTWFENECTDGQKKMMLDDLEIGAAAAIRGIDATYGAGKMSDSGRAAKASIKQLDLETDTERRDFEDKVAGVDSQIDFWEVLKARAAYMKNPAKGDKLIKTLQKRHKAHVKKRRRRR